MKMILAASSNGVIGYADGSLPFHLPEDLKNFKRLTTGQVVFMGRKTFESLPFSNGLPNRVNVILSRSGIKIVNNTPNDVEPEDLFVSYDSDAWVIGGAEIYDYFLSLGVVKEIWLTDVTLEVDTKDAVFFDIHSKLKERGNSRIVQATLHHSNDINFAITKIKI